MNKRFSIPSKFELSNEVALNNPDFHLVKVRIMSSGENYNGSSFTINSLNNAKDSVAYTPVLANIVKREDGQYDYNGHDVDTEIKMDYNGNVMIEETYIERPVGVFLNNSTEIKYDEELEVNYIQAYAILWGTYSKSVEILKRDGVKDVSVEIEVLQGEFREDGYYEIQEYNILGTTLLGNDNLPAIEGSKVEMCFSMNKDEEYENKINEIDELLKTFSLKGGETMENEKQEFEQEIEQEEVCEECGKNPCECEDDKEEEKEEDFAKEEDEETEEDKEEEKEGPQEDEKKYSQEEVDVMIENVRAEYSQVLEELKSLREFKAEYDRQIEVQNLNCQLDEIVANFNVDEDIVKDLKEKVIEGQMTMETFELHLWRKNQPTKKDFSKDKQTNKLPVIDNEKKMSDIDAFFASYGINKK